jgi:hypothetical protein
MNSRVSSFVTVSHGLMHELASIHKEVNELPQARVCELSDKATKLSGRVFQLEIIIEGILLQLQDANTKDRVICAGQWSFEHGGIFAGTLLENDRAVNHVYVGAVINRFTAVAMRALSVPEDGGSAWFDGTKNSSLFSHVRSVIGRHPIFVPYEEWLNTSARHNEIAPFVMYTRTVPVRSE